MDLQNSGYHVPDSVLWTVVAAFLLAVAPQADGAEDKIWTSIINLIATPEKFDSQRVMVSGFVTIEPENQVICLARNVPSGKECLWLEVGELPFETEAEAKDFDAELLRWARDYDGKIVTLTGVFDMRDKGHLSNQSGSLKKLAVELVSEGND